MNHSEGTEMIKNYSVFLERNKRNCGIIEKIYEINPNRLNHILLFEDSIIYTMVRITRHFYQTISFYIWDDDLSLSYLSDIIGGNK